MRLSKESLAELRKKLSRGSARQIRVRLMDKGIRFSQQYISNCLSPGHPDYNPIIIEEAIKLGEEEATQMYELHHRIKLLNNSI